jgi:hypothetical protein
MSWFDNAKAAAATEMAREKQQQESERQRQLRAQEEARLRFAQLCSPWVQIVDKTLEPFTKEGIEVGGPSYDSRSVDSLPVEPSSEFRFTHTWEEWSDHVREVNYEVRVPCYSWHVDLRPNSLTILVVVAKQFQPIFVVFASGGLQTTIARSEADLQGLLFRYTVDYFKKEGITS